VNINPQKCVACGNCTYVCPMGAIYVDPAINRATIDRDECVECYACYNGMSKEQLNPTLIRAIRGLFKLMRLRFEPEPDVCPTSALEPEELAWPRIVRRAFSDPRVPHESTGIAGRGTEEVKTNDVSGRVHRGQVGFTVEFGRPGVGVRLRDIQTMTMALAPAGVVFEKKNPVTSLIADVSRGTLRPEILDEKILSAIVEIKVPFDLAEKVVAVVREIKPHIRTVIALGVQARCDDDGEETMVLPVLRRLGYNPVRAKTNTGLGRVTNVAPGSLASSFVGAG
jgi:ferredoxin